jgi:thioredoxin 1
MSQIITLTKENIQKEVFESDQPVLIDFWAPWCQPCLMMVPVLEELATELEGKIKFAKINVALPENQELAREYEIQSIPNMKLFKKNQVVKDFIGLQPKEELKSKLQAEI